MGKLKINLDFSLKRLDLVVKGLVNTKFLGNYKSVFKGSGLEFADYRRYDPGSDDASRIDWKASKRVNDVLVKEFVEERNVEVIFLIDVSSQMLLGSTKKLKAEYIAELTASLSQSVLGSGDSVGFVLFSDKVLKKVLPQNGMKQLYSLTRELSNVNNYGGSSDIDNVLDFAFKNFDKGSLVVLISDFIYGLKNERLVKLMSKKFDFITIMVRDPRDMTLPEGHGQLVVEDPYSGSTLLIDPNKIRDAYAAETRGQVTKVKSLMKKSGADFLFLDTSKEFIKELIMFFKMRETLWR